MQARRRRTKLRWRRQPVRCEWTWAHSLDWCEFDRGSSGLCQGDGDRSELIEEVLRRGISKVVHHGAARFRDGADRSIRGYGVPLPVTDTRLCQRQASGATSSSMPSDSATGGVRESPTRNSEQAAKAAEEDDSRQQPEAVRLALDLRDRAPEAEADRQQQAREIAVMNSSTRRRSRPAPRSHPISRRRQARPLRRRRRPEGQCDSRP